MNLLSLIECPPIESWPVLATRPAKSIQQLEELVLPILQEVKANGDTALKYYTKKFDLVELSELLVTHDEILEAIQSVPDALKDAIQQAKSNIEVFHSSQQHKVEIVETMPGIRCWRQVSPIERVGLYVPGGTAPLFSTVLMLAIPAYLAGCSEVVLCSPPQSDGKIHPTILYAAHLCGVHRVVKTGGAQAIAAMAYGTQSVPKVDKVFGPGNAFVTIAKQLISKEGVSIDMPAGPSEVLVIADDQANPAFVAADLLSQAEHGTDSQVILATVSVEFVLKVEKELHYQLESLSRSDIASKTLQNSKAIVFDNIVSCIDFSNFYAPEHLIVQLNDADKWADKITNAGSVFLGHYTPESVGDYASGTNHTLPTYGFAKAYSGVSLDSFVKKITFQSLSMDGIRRIGHLVETMAEAEGLSAHKNAVSVRLATLE